MLLRLFRLVVTYGASDTSFRRWFSVNGVAARQMQVEQVWNPAGVLAEAAHTLRQWLLWVRNEMNYTHVSILMREPVFAGGLPATSPQYPAAADALRGLRLALVSERGGGGEQGSPYTRNLQSRAWNWDPQEIFQFRNEEGICYLNAAIAAFLSIPSLLRELAIGQTKAHETRSIKPLISSVGYSDFFDSDVEVDTLLPEYRDDPFYQALLQMMRGLGFLDRRKRTLGGGPPPAPIVATLLYRFLPRRRQQDVGIVTQAVHLLSRQDRLDTVTVGGGMTRASNNVLSSGLGKARQHYVIAPDLIEERVRAVMDEHDEEAPLPLSRVLDDAYGTVNHIHIRESGALVASRSARDSPYSVSSPGRVVYAFAKDSWVHAGDVLVIAPPRQLSKEGIARPLMWPCALNLELDVRAYMANPVAEHPDEYVYMLRSVLVVESSGDRGHAYTIVRDLPRILEDDCHPKNINRPYWMQINNDDNRPVNELGHRVTGHGASTGGYLLTLNRDESPEYKRHASAFLLATYIRKRAVRATIEQHPR